MHIRSNPAGNVVAEGISATADGCADILARRVPSVEGFVVIGEVAFKFLNNGTWPSTCVAYHVLKVGQQPELKLWRTERQSVDQARGWSLCGPLDKFVNDLLWPLIAVNHAPAGVSGVKTGLIDCLPEPF